MITYNEVIERLPQSIDCEYDIYLIGSIIVEGYSNKDVDFLIIEKINKTKNLQLEMYLLDYLKYSVHIFSGVALKNEYFIKIYENGCLVNH